MADDKPATEVATLDDIPAAMAPSYDAFESWGKPTIEGPSGDRPVVIEEMTSMEIHDGVITARKVEIKRNMPAIIAECKALAAAAGPAYFYRWPVKKKGGGTEMVEGETIVLASDLARIWGNCEVGCRVKTVEGHWILEGIFVDYEKGYKLSRPFAQRKKQNIGEKYDSERAENIVFAIGVSKATRNVVLKALPTLAAFMMREAKRNVLKNCQENSTEALQWIVDQLNELRIDIVRVETIYGTAANKWLAPDLAKIYAEITGIKENMVDADVLWPPVNLGGSDDDPVDDKKPAARKAAAKKPKADPKPNAEKDDAKKDQTEETGGGKDQASNQPPEQGGDKSGESQQQEGSTAGPFSE